jgi:hypothetical protein
MTLIRALMLALAVLLPTSWTLAHAAGDEAGGDKSAETKPKKSKKSKKKEGGEAGGDTKKDEAK